MRFKSSSMPIQVHSDFTLYGRICIQKCWKDDWCLPMDVAEVIAVPNKLARPLERLDLYSGPHSIGFWVGRIFGKPTFCNMFWDGCGAARWPSFFAALWAKLWLKNWHKFILTSPPYWAEFARLGSVLLEEKLISLGWRFPLLCSGACLCVRLWFCADRDQLHRTDCALIPCWPLIVFELTGSVFCFFALGAFLTEECWILVWPAHPQKHVDLHLIWIWKRSSNFALGRVLKEDVIQIS